jgi:predicted DNA binding CopG/RHH family protein
MQRVHIFLPLKTIAALKKAAKASGLPFAELVRRAIDAGMAKS